MYFRLIGIIFVLCSVLLESFAQLCFKLSATKYSATSLRRYWVFLGIMLFAADVWAWTIALHHLDISMAYPMGSLSFVGIAILSQLCLKENVSRKRWLGVGLIISGTTLVSLF